MVTFKYRRKIDVLLYGLLLGCLLSSLVKAEPVENSLQLVDELIASHPQQDAAFVLESGQASLLARAWLAQQARNGIDVQYFIWSSDNIGILAAHFLLQAAQRGVQVRVIVDDLLIDTTERSLIALAAHPNIHIKIYNPKHSVGVSVLDRIKNVLTDFHGVNQRMHDKTFMVDGKVAITGGRNMADEYFDYDRTCNFRDRDVLVMGEVVSDMRNSFERFWRSDLSVPVEKLLSHRVALSQQQIEAFYTELHDYAANVENFEPQVRAAINNLHKDFAELINDIVWAEVSFISDEPGKNNQGDFHSGGRASRAMTDRLARARRSVTIQSPYLVMTPSALDFFRGLVARGVQVSISTNSLASTDNLMAYSGYSKQRDALLQAGIRVFELKPYPDIQKSIMHRYGSYRDHLPMFAIHAKTMVIDHEQAFIGTFNFDPRSVNLNTEVGIWVQNEQLAQQVEAAIGVDMAPGNSWRAGADDPEQYASWYKRIKLFFLKLLPLDPVL